MSNKILGLLAATRVMNLYQALIGGSIFPQIPSSMKICMCMIFSHSLQADGLVLFFLLLAATTASSKGKNIIAAMRPTAKTRSSPLMFSNVITTS